ncbi:MAG: gamma-glutamyltransferase [Rhizobiales bacterium 65-9]|nr:gamma-glutamyltransferase family protein [Hyphomicrobiales bacterium]OJY39450.1 MAG: gamma-glutamyltransferase [Rhizobiales bacterium 65-9]
MHQYQGPGRAAAFAANAMCATSHPLAAQVALDALARGGNAVDAAVAGALVLTFCEPMMCGLGGDAFAMLRLPGQDSILGLNGSGRAPAALDAVALRKAGLDAVPTESPHSVTIPGAIDAFSRLIKQYGALDFASALAPAIRCAEEGVPVCHRSAIDWRAYGGRLQGAGRTHFLRDGAPYRAGDVFRAPAQAEALKLIAREGADAFYRGPIMEDMLEALREAGGVHTAADFEQAAANPTTPISCSYRGHDLIELPPNGQGATALLIANILARFDLGKLDPNGAARTHLEAEATRLAYDARDRFVADPEGRELRIEHMLSNQTADALAALIDPRRATPRIAGLSEPVHRDTVYICVVDSDRLAVSLIYSTFWPFGCGLASKRFGVGLHNRGASFSLRPGSPNELKGGRRPLHTLIPGFASKQNEYLMPFGVMGGPYQAAGHAHFLSNVADWGMDIQDAIDAPRAFADPATGRLVVEAGFTDSVVGELEAMGHVIERAPIGMGGAQAIMIDWKRDLLIGATDPRKDGVALGA